MSGKLRIPVYVRVGQDGAEHRVGNVVCDPGEDVSTRVPGVLRGVAAEMERPAAARVVHYRYPAVCGSGDPGYLWSGDLDRVTCEACHPCPNEPTCGHPASAHDPQAGPPGDPPWCLDCDCGSSEELVTVSRDDLRLLLQVIPSEEWTRGTQFADSAAAAARLRDAVHERKDSTP